MSAAPSRLKVGVDVPWVTSWSEETVSGAGPCPSVDGVLALFQEDRPGVGKPLYSRNHLFRQRLSVRSMLCPMCGQATSDDDRWSQTGRYTTAREIRAKGLSAYVPKDFKPGRKLFDAGAIAPLHRACAENALLHCPHLGGMADRTLKPFPRSWLVAPLTVELKPAVKPGAKPQPSISAVSFVQLLGIVGD